MDEVKRWVPTASVLHSNGDGLDIAVKGGRMVGVRGRAVDRVNHGRLDRPLFKVAAVRNWATSSAVASRRRPAS